MFKRSKEPSDFKILTNNFVEQRNTMTLIGCPIITEQNKKEKERETRAQGFKSLTQARIFRCAREIAL